MEARKLTVKGEGLTVNGEGRKAAVGIGAEPPVRRSAKLADEVPENQRPREKLLAAGSAAKLSDAELLAILLGSGTKGHNVMSVAEALVLQYKTLAFLAQATPNELRKIKGIGAVKAVQISAMMELARRALASAHDENETNFAGNPALIAKETLAHCAGFRTESFFVLPLDKKLRKCGPMTLISQGTLDRVIAHPREVFAVAVRWGAAAVAVAHNHPSGDPAPSKDDERTTVELFAAGKAMHIPLADHLIVGDATAHPPGYYSFHAMRPDLFV